VASTIDTGFLAKSSDLVSVVAGIEVVPACLLVGGTKERIVAVNFERPSTFCPSLEDIHSPVIKHDRTALPTLIVVDDEHLPVPVDVGWANVQGGTDSRAATVERYEYGFVADA